MSSMRNDGLTKTYYANAALVRHTIVNLATDTTVQTSTAAAQLHMGVLDGLGDAATGEPVDVIMDGIATVRAGGTITRGQPITANATGQGIAATAGAGVRIIGFAMTSAVSGDLFPVFIRPGYFSA